MVHGSLLPGEALAMHVKVITAAAIYILLSSKIEVGAVTKLLNRKIIILLILDSK